MSSYQINRPRAPLTLDHRPVDLIGGELVEVLDPVTLLALGASIQHGNGSLFRCLKR
jgi:hypothetical protein